MTKMRHQDEHNGGGKGEAWLAGGQQPPGGADAAKRGGGGEHEGAACERGRERGGRAGGQREEGIERDTAAEKRTGAATAAEAQRRGPDVAGDDGGQGQRGPGAGRRDPAREENGQGAFRGVERKDENAGAGAENTPDVGRAGDPAALRAEVSAGLAPHEPPTRGEATERVGKDEGEDEHERVSVAEGGALNAGQYFEGSLVSPISRSLNLLLRVVPACFQPLVETIGRLAGQGMPGSET